jgi:hypothetical protein
MESTNLPPPSQQARIDELTELNAHLTEDLAARTNDAKWWASKHAQAAKQSNRAVTELADLYRRVEGLIEKVHDSIETLLHADRLDTENTLRVGNAEALTLLRAGLKAFETTNKKPAKKESLDAFKPEYPGKCTICVIAAACPNDNKGPCPPFRDNPGDLIG